MLRPNMRANLLLLATAFLALASCGGGGGSDNSTGPGDPGGPDTSPFSGVLVDSAVENISYRSSPSGLNGVTDSDGTFLYMPGDNVIFSVGSVDLPAVRGARFVTPFEIAEGPGPVATNIARFLQSLDLDGDISERIVIDDIAISAISGVSEINFELTTTFEAQASAFFEALEMITGSMILFRSEAQALEHLNSTIGDFVDPRLATFDTAQFVNRKVYNVFALCIDEQAVSCDPQNPNEAEWFIWEFIFSDSTVTIGIVGSAEPFFEGEFSFDDAATLTLSGIETNGDEMIEVEQTIVLERYVRTRDLYSVCSIVEGNDCQFDVPRCLDTFVFEFDQAQAIVANRGSISPECPSLADN